MHQLQSISIGNFRSVQQATLPLSSATALVGYNNAGKSNILKALNWLINKSRLTDGDFGDVEQPVSVTATITGIDENVLEAIGANHRGKIEALLGEGDSLVIRRVQETPATAIKDIKLAVRSFDDDGNENWGNPAGIDAAIGHLFPDPIFVGAMENATEDVGKFASGTTIGKLIKEIIEPIKEAHAEALVGSLSDLSAALSANGENKDASLVDVDEKIAEELSAIFPGVAAKTHIPTPLIDDLFKSATIKLFERDGQGRDVASMGHGAQRSIQIALLKSLARIRREAVPLVGRTTLLLIDEPELYLHPQAIELVRASLCSLADDGYQVLYTTHSPLMIAREEASNALLVRRTHEDGTSVLSRIKEAVTAAIDDAARQAEILFSLSNSVKFLFAEKVLLVEGLTERTLIPEIFQQEVGSRMEAARIAVVDLESSGGIIPGKKVLDAMGLPCKVVADLDFAFRVASSHGLLDDDDADIAACKGVLATAAANDEVTLDESGLPQKGNGKTAAQGFEHLAQQADAVPHIQSLHDKLRAQDVWLWRSGAMEAPLGLTSKKPSAHLAFIQSMSDAAFAADLPNYFEAREMIAWIRE